MLEFLFGFGFGIIIGTKYNCKPYIDFLLYTVKNTLKDIKSDYKDEIKLGENLDNEDLFATLINNELKKEN
jgi:hypothetical protein